MYTLTDLKIKIREELNPYLAPYRLKRLIRKGGEKIVPFSIISNDCWAGHVYRYYGLTYTSPTIGTGFFAEDYIKFISNLRYYLEMNLEMITAQDSVHYNEIRKHAIEFQTCPYGRLGDVELRFGHYSTPNEAYKKWCKRRDRMNYDNLIVKMSEHNGCTYEILKQFDNLSFEKKIVFVTRDYGLNSQVIYREYEGCDDIINGTNRFRDYIDIDKLILGRLFIK